MGIFKENWKKDFALFYLLAYFFGIILFAIHLTYNLSYWLQLALLVPLIFFSLYWALSKFAYTKLTELINKLSKGNNLSYFEVKSREKLLDLLGVHATYFAISFIYFYFIFEQYNHPFKSRFEYHLFLFFIGGLIVIFVRTTHYSNPDIGNKIGDTIAYFFFPFGLLIAAVLLANFTGGKNIDQIFESIIRNWQMIPYFFMLLCITMSLDIILDAKTRYRLPSDTKKETIEEKRASIVEYHDTLYSIDCPKHKTSSMNLDRRYWNPINDIEKKINNLQEKKKKSHIDKKVDKLLSKYKKT